MSASPVLKASSSSEATPAAASSAGSVAAKKARRRGARASSSSSSRKQHSWHLFVDDLLKRSPKLAKIQTINSQASAFSSSSLKLFFEMLALRADSTRLHCARSTFQHKDVETAMRSLYAYAPASVQEELEAMLAGAKAATEAVYASRPHPPPKKEAGDKNEKKEEEDNGPSDEE